MHGTLGVASFVPGISVLTGAADAAIYAAEGEMVEAGIAAASMIPGGKVVTTAGKAIKGAVNAGTAAKAVQTGKAAKEAAEQVAAKEARDKVAKAAEEKAVQKSTETQAGSGGKGKDGTTVKGKGKLKCGEYGKFGRLKKKTGEGKFDRDHIPSKAALKERARRLKGKSLSKEEANAIDNYGDAIAIPRQAHIDVSPTYGQSPGEAMRDASNLAGAARRDVEAMLKKIDEYDADGGCKKAYQKAAKRILRKDNVGIDDELMNVLSKFE